ncbi:DUF1854 domain-containing protein [bacterium]|nr:DUF1854 domain-containing protein [bacterium]
MPDMTASDMTPSDMTRQTGTSTEGWRLERHAHGRLDFIDCQGLRHANVDVLRAFPVSDPAGPAAIVAVDGGELAWIESLSAVAAPLRTILETELAQREFLPRIERVAAVSDGEPAEWTVVTDRGPHRFKVSHADDFVMQPDGGAFVTDSHGMRYAIPSIAALDPHSRRLLDRKG